MTIDIELFPTNNIKESTLHSFFLTLFEFVFNLIVNFQFSPKSFVSHIAPIVFVGR